MIRRVGRLALAALLASASLGQAQEAKGGSAEIFRRYADRVVKIQVVETGSGAKSSLGTAFFVTPSGLLLTNYHVVAQSVNEPERYRTVWIGAGGTSAPAGVLAIDVINDLAVLDTGSPSPRYFPLAATNLAKGVRLYSLGHPEDLGLSIVEGTYNGNLEHALYPKAHFTGPLNPGMSGGPALTAAGQVVGVNVATEGNSVSFLVPIEAAIPLVTRADEDTTATGDIDLLDDAGRQVLENQDRYLSQLFRGDSTVRLGPFLLPTQPAPFFRCWADAERKPEALFELIEHQCSTDDYIYLSGEQPSGIVTLEHRVLISRGLSPLRFYSLYSGEFLRATDRTSLDPDDETTSYRCRNDNVRRGGMLLRMIFCVRRYRMFAGLYDARVKVAVLGARDVGLITQLTLSAVSFENAERVARYLVNRIRWAPR